MTQPPAVLEDTRLIKLALEGDAECFAALIDRHLGTIKIRIRSMVRNEADAEDLAQEVILQVWRRLSTFRFESGFRTWLTRVTINEVLQAYRQDRREPSYAACCDFTDLASAADSPHQSFVRSVEIRAVRSAVLELPIRYRRVLVLRDLEELSEKETAQRLQSTVPTVKTRLFRARRMLSATLKRSNNRGFANTANFHDTGELTSAPFDC